MKMVTGVMLAVALMAVPAAASDAAVAGTWTGQKHNQPSIKLTVIDHGGK